MSGVVREKIRGSLIRLDNIAIFLFLPFVHPTIKILAEGYNQQKSIIKLRRFKYEVQRLT